MADYSITAVTRRAVFSGSAGRGPYSFTFPVLAETDLAVYITSDEEVIDAENKIGYLETVVDYIKGVIKSVDNRGWDIKNAIEWKKFEAGVTY